MPGIRISAIRHPVRDCCPESRNSSADAKTRAGIPAIFMRPCKASRMDSSSSTIETILFSFALDYLSNIWLRRTRAQSCFSMSCEKHEAGTKGRYGQLCAERYPYPHD